MSYNFYTLLTLKHKQCLHAFQNFRSMFHARGVDDVALVCVSVVVVANRHDRVRVVAEEHRWWEKNGEYRFFMVKF